MQNSMDANEKIEMSSEVLKKILDHSPSEIYVLDKNARIVFINKVCERHYGVKLDEVIGKHNDEMAIAKKYWNPRILPLVLKEKKTVTIKQMSYVGKELITTAIPLLNDNQEIELIITTGQEADYKDIHLPDEQETEEEIGAVFYKENIITNNEEMNNVVKLCKKVSKVDTTVLIQGESGTGKGVIAKYIHKTSHRSHAPFLSINCATIPEELLESELFGYAEGAFTGATKSGKQGLLEIANGGTVFLDEIGEISPKVQAKLLQVIQDFEFLPIGGKEIRKVDIRIISATNQNLYEMVQNKQFREDLYYRLHVVNLQIPPLRERKEDIIPLTYYFLSVFNKKYQVNRIISQDVLDIFYTYSWPGNIRQLENMIESLVITSDGMIQVSDLPAILLENIKKIEKGQSPSVSALDLDSALEEVEKKMVIDSYTKYRSTRKVAEHLSISQSKAVRLVRKHCSQLDFYN
ncbi:sigma 54-interacting transcriptional regulator [Aneurinibacillus aneurinilyticus]|uniref:sigma-54 interaction domain-containing protein n=1 Tax=Aneurinibacillus aneurinilyticus TaxID=1391 RepID=UPI0023F2E97E|nr:sigma 54-interacting transcriptional regulator [Aneurinibacillus aneurinilyticus]MED0669698.1 sigma 54-interacting transcriptional regulator [Aneurinibacillus aneurinilyticus]